MASSKSILIGGGITVAVIGIAALIRKARAVDNFRYELEAFKVKSTGLLNTMTSVDLRIINPSAEVLSFDSFIGKLLNKGNQIATFEISKAVKIPAKSSVKIQVPIAISNTAMASSIFDVLKNGLSAALKEPFIFKGQIKAGSVTLPVNQQISLTQ